MGTECLSATSLIFRARASTPLATHTGASIPRSYSSATAKWVGLVNDSGFWNCCNHTAAHAELPYLLHLSFDGRVTFRLFEFLFQLADRHFLPLVPLPILK